MNVEFDPAKDAGNLAKHGVSLADAARLDWGALLCAPDTRRDYGELREMGLAPLGGRLYALVFVQRGDVFRVVSLRKANQREVQRYDEAIEAFGFDGSDG